MLSLLCLGTKRLSVSTIGMAKCQLCTPAWFIWPMSECWIAGRPKYFALTWLREWRGGVGWCGGWGWWYHDAALSSGFSQVCCWAHKNSWQRSNSAHLGILSCDFVSVTATDSLQVFVASSIFTCKIEKDFPFFESCPPKSVSPQPCLDITGLHNVGAVKLKVYCLIFKYSSSSSVLLGSKLHYVDDSVYIKSTSSSTVAVPVAWNMLHSLIQWL